MLYHARKIRAVLSPESEYRLRRALTTILPAKTGGPSAVVHACTWKTGSQWVRIILSDPRFYLETGLRPYAYRPNSPTTVIEPRSILTSAFIDFETYDQIERPEDCRAFFVVRNPRDLCVSRFYSAKYSHPRTGNMDEVRAKLHSMSDEDGLIYTITHRFEPLASRIGSWLKAAEARDIPIIRFEELTGPDRVAAWETLTRRLGLEVRSRTIESLLNFYRVERFRPKTATLKSKEVKYRSGKPGEWADHFTPRVTKMFDDLYGDLPGRLGYPD